MPETGSDEGDDRERLCPICLVKDQSHLVEPVTTNCGHLSCWPCLFRAFKNSNNSLCPVCKQLVTRIQAVFAIGSSRGPEHFDIPPRPSQGEDPFESLNFREAMEAPRRSVRSRTTNTRLNGYVELPSAGTARDGSVADSPQSVARRQQSSGTDPVQQQPGTLRPSSAPSQQQTGTLGPSTAHAQQQPGTLRPSSAPSQQQTWTLGPSTAHAQQQPGTLRPSSAPTQQQTGTLGPSSAHAQQQPGNLPGVGINPAAHQAGIVGTSDTAGRLQAVESFPSQSSPQLDPGEDLEPDFSDDEERARREFEAENAPHLRNQTARFKIKDFVPGADNKSHLDIVVREVEQQMMTYQVKLSQVNWMGIARNVRNTYPWSFPGREGELKDYRSVSKLCGNGLKKAVRLFKAKTSIMGRSGNSGPPDTELERSLRTIISIDASAPATRRMAPSGRRSSRPMMLDPQPISTSSNMVPFPLIPAEPLSQRGQAPAGHGQDPAGHGQDPAGHGQAPAGHGQASGSNRIPLSDLERSEAARALNLDEPMASYRQQRETMASQGQELRENSLAEMHSRRRASTTELRAVGSSAIEGATSTIQAMASQKSSIEHLVFNNMEIRREERDHDREERRRTAAIEKEEREQRAKMEKEERERRELREERRLALEKEEKDRKELLLFKIIGISSNKTERKEVTVQAVHDGSESQPFPTKLILTTLKELKKDLCEYMGPSEVAGIVLRDGADPFILTDVNQIEGDKYDVSRVTKRGMSYFNMTGVV